MRSPPKQIFVPKGVLLRLCLFLYEAGTRIIAVLIDPYG